MNGSHEELFDEVAAYALGALGPNDAARAREHLATCAECRAEYDALRPTVTALANSAEACPDLEHGAVVASPMLKARIMRDVRADAAAKSKSKSNPTPGTWSVYVTAASIAIAIGVSMYAFNLSERLNHLQTQVSHADSADAQMLADLKNPTAKRYPVDGGEVVVSDGHVYLTMIDLPAPPLGKVYQAWTLGKGAKAVAPSLTFSPDSRGIAMIALPNDAATLAAVAISVEPVGGSKAPTSKPLFVRPLV